MDIPYLSDREAWAETGYLEQISNTPTSISTLSPAFYTIMSITILSSWSF